MIHYIHPTSPDDRIIANAIKLLRDGELICLPSDTNWLILCDLENKDGIEKLYRMKKEEPDKHFSVLVSDISMAQNIAEITNRDFKILKKILPGHYTIILNAFHKTSKKLKATKQDKQVGIRIPPIDWLRKLISHSENGLLSSNITNDLLSLSENDPVYSYLIEEKLGTKLKMIIDPGEVEFIGPSSIINLCDQIPEIMRQGAGDCSIFE